MHKLHALRIFLLGFFSLLVFCSCAPFKTSDSRAGMCNELNSQIIFNGATANQRRADIERSQAPLMKRSYDKHCDTSSL